MSPSLIFDDDCDVLSIFGKNLMHTGAFKIINEMEFGKNITTWTKVSIIGHKNVTVTFSQKEVVPSRIK